MGDTLLGRTRANIDEPLAQKRFVDERSPPERSCERWPFRHFQHAMARNSHELAGRQRPYGMIHAFRMKLCRSQKSPGIRYATMWKRSRS
jgi:hypothetical protein